MGIIFSYITNYNLNICDDENKDGKKNTLNFSQEIKDTEKLEVEKDILLVKLKDSTLRKKETDSKLKKLLKLNNSFFNNKFLVRSKSQDTSLEDDLKIGLKENNILHLSKCNSVTVSISFDRFLDISNLNYTENTKRVEELAKLVSQLSSSQNNNFIEDNQDVVQRRNFLCCTKLTVKNVIPVPEELQVKATVISGKIYKTKSPYSYLFGLPEDYIWLAARNIYKQKEVVLARDFILAETPTTSSEKVNLKTLTSIDPSNANHNDLKDNSATNKNNYTSNNVRNICTPHNDDSVVAIPMNENFTTINFNNESLHKEKVSSSVGILKSPYYVSHAVKLTRLENNSFTLTFQINSFISCKATLFAMAKEELSVAENSVIQTKTSKVNYQSELRKSITCQPGIRKEYTILLGKYCKNNFDIDIIYKKIMKLNEGDERRDFILLLENEEEPISLVSYFSLEESISAENYVLNMRKQIIYVGPVGYMLQEIYGTTKLYDSALMYGSEEPLYSSDDFEKEISCAVCLSAPKTTGLAKI